jgi:hypothetical protein
MKAYVSIHDSLTVLVEAGMLSSGGGFGVVR